MVGVHLCLAGLQRSREGKLAEGISSMAFGMAASRDRLLCNSCA